MIDLTIAETSQFYELTGVTYTKAQQAFSPKPCAPHRLAIRACKPCAVPGVAMCPEHLEAFGDCDHCAGGGLDAPEAWLAAVIYLVRKRDGETRSWDEFTREMNYSDLHPALAELGNAGGEPAEKSIAHGSRRSSTGTQGSEA